MRPRSNKQTPSAVEASIANARTGSFSALGKLLDHYRDYLLRIANEELASDLVPKMAASDLVQETFLQAARDFRKFTGGGEAELRVWLRRILLNNVHDVTRRYRVGQKRAAAREVPLAMVGQDLLLGAAQKSVVEEPRSMADDQEALCLALQQLSVDHRSVIELRSLEGRTFDEIGARMGRSADAVRKLWARAVEQLSIRLSSPDDARSRPL